MFFPHPRRDPEQPITSQHFALMARDALLMVRTIQDYLPVQGDADPKAHQFTIDDWYRQAADLYERIERLRNPEYYPFHRGRCQEFPTQMGDALDDLCEHYGWQGISDRKGYRPPNCRGGGTIPAIQPRILESITQFATSLLEYTQRTVPPA